MDLGQLLHETFGHNGFRPLQEEVCRAVAAGDDVLLVMPTGAGKSLCYQLPGLARGGTTLVLSPLIALMEDQVAALAGRGLRAERIHSGRDRADSRAVCRRYLEGGLDFLFVAPERLAVPGFPEMLARRPPVLIAVDEAHCISHWGHDFRPEYRMLQQRLPMLRPAPVIALTATATPVVQRDILEQLEIPEAKRFIHGFRRDNIAVEVVEATPSLRRDLVRRLLADRGRRPAIVYTPTRKEAEGLGAELAEDFPAAAYHAGMSPAIRDQGQRAFQSGGIEVIVATIAFGMGIDKPDVRTVVHTGLPGTLEGYYQEIGRAGRDGAAARAVLLFSWSDRHTHEFFLERDYPEPRILEALYAALGSRPRPVADLRAALGLADEVFAAALEKLWIHRGAIVDPEENAARGRPDWRQPYERQRAHRRDQIERVMAFAGGRGCRMLQLVEHFGDQHDSGRPCGACDQCAPEHCEVVSFRAPTRAEHEVLAAVLDLLRDTDGLSTGQLHRQAVGPPAMARPQFESLIDGLSRAGLVDVRADSFVKDGRTIRFQRAWLTRRARLAGADGIDGVRLVKTADPVARPRRAAGRARGAAAPKTARPAAETVLGVSERALFERLRAWRLEEARRRRVPAFRILSDRTLVAICRARPADEEELLEVAGIGPAILSKYGSKVL
ncbi:MAG TPA: ATP-dependent DNA helicase RecQ, partial [Chondromyces sp.]|nr:ATP-dependent DNA helicase RecQ [Chondromyces sp.]